MTFSMSLAGFVVSSLWTIYGHLVQDKFITVSCGPFKISRYFRVTSALPTVSPSRPKDVCYLYKSYCSLLKYLLF